MLNEASLTDVMEPVGAIFLSRTALKEKLFHSGGLMQSCSQIYANCHVGLARQNWAWHWSQS